MKIALTVWNGRIAPVFDVARQLLILEVNSGSATTEKHAALTEEDQVNRIARLKELGIRILICGAISRSAQTLAESLGIEVNGFIAGDVKDVITAWQERQLDSKAFSMPGCGESQRKCCRRMRNGNRYKKESQS